MPLRSLRSRIVLFFVVLLALVQGAALLLVDAFNEHTARLVIRHELRVGEKVFLRLIEQNSARLTQAAAILSLDFAFREAVATVDLPTVQSVLLNHGARIGADQMALVSLDGRLLADTRNPARAGGSYPLDWLLKQAEAQGNAAGIAMLDGRAFQMAVVPVRAPAPIAWAVFGVVVDDRLARDLRNLANMDVSFLSRRADGWSVIASTLGDELHESLKATLPAAPQAGQAGPRFLGGREHETLVLTFEGAGPSGIVAVLGRPLDEALGPARRVGAVLIALLAGSVAISILGSVLIARGVTRPLQLLSAMTQRLEEGDYSQPVRGEGPDEVRDLARRFDHMREAIAAREEQVTRLAYRDTLTDLPNRVLFNDRLRVAIEVARRANLAVAVLLMDLDRFKYINDTLGHHVGDLVLQQVASRVSGLVRKADTTARLGGDEFAVLLSDTALEEARAVAAKISASLEGAMEVGQHSLDVRASVGIAVFPSHGQDAETLLRHADAAMYAAKRGHLGTAVYDPKDHEQRDDHLSLLSDLRHAIDHGELRLVYQPKLDLAEGRVTGVEALLRWRHVTRGSVPPDRFIPFAEQTGFIKTLTRWVIDAAARQAAAWSTQGCPLQLAINISAQDLASPELGDILVAALARHRVAPEHLCLEITESGIMRDAARAISMLKRVQAIGVRRSIDDFGTGYSSLAYVKRLAVDELKIDRSFVRNIVQDPKDRAIVLSTIELAHNLGLTVTAEGVEDQAALDVLRSLGCDAIQGYVVARPLEADELEGWLAAR